MTGDERHISTDQPLNIEEQEMKKIVVSLISAAALAAVVATPAWAIETAGSPVHYAKGEAKAELALLTSGGGVKTDLCEYEKCGGTASALEYATAWAGYYWGEPVLGEYCTGPYGNGKTHNETQWACYGWEYKGSFVWQVNVDPWGAPTYHHKY